MSHIKPMTCEEYGRVHRYPDWKCVGDNCLACYLIGSDWARRQMEKGRVQRLGVAKESEELKIATAVHRVLDLFDKHIINKEK